MEQVNSTGHSSSPEPPRLRMEGITKRFGATTALEGVHLSVRAGEIEALIGENGAGKSTLMKILSGAIRADEGNIWLDGEPYAPRNPESAVAGKQVQIQVQEALLRLPEDLRMAIVLYDIEGLAYREIAAVLEVPEGTVKSRIHRARNALRDRLEGLVARGNKGER